MTKDTQAIESLRIVLDALRPRVKAGDKNAFVEYAMGKALYEALNAGYWLSDVEWFKNTRHYTGDRHEQSMTSHV